MVTAPVLQLPDFNLTFYVETDASDAGIGAVLLQRGHPLAFFSKKLGPRRRAASTYHKELYAIVESVQKWRQYLLGREFVIRSDQRSLKDLHGQVIQTPEQQFYIRKLMGFKFRIEYKTGASNKVADALSRRDSVPDAGIEDTVQLFLAYAQPMPLLLQDIRRDNDTLEDCQTLHKAVHQANAPPHITLHNGLLYYKHRLYISPESPLRQKLLHEFHSTPLAGHQGVDRTFKRLADVFYWCGMRRDTDGQTEVMNRGLEQYLRAFTFERPKKWATFIPWAELALNCGHHEGLNMSPYQALYGHPPPHLFPTLAVRARDPTIEEMLRERAEVLTDIRHNLTKMQQHMRERANRHRRDLTFQVGNRVLLKLQQYRHHSLARPQSSKLARRYYGPFEVIERIGPVAYRLQLPEGCKIHNVFHVSLLRPFVLGGQPLPKPTLPTNVYRGKEVAIPISAGPSRTVLVDGIPQEQWLIRWSDDGGAAATWEPMENIRKHFPHLDLEDKAAFNPGGVDTVVVRGEDTLDTAHVEDSPTNEAHAVCDDPLRGDEPTDEDREDSRLLGRPRRQARRPKRYDDYVYHQSISHTIQNMSHEDLAADQKKLKKELDLLMKKIGEFKNSVDIPTFEGRNDPEKFLKVLAKVEHVFTLKDIPEDKKAKLVVAKFQKHASTWWASVAAKRRLQGKAKPGDLVWVHVQREHISNKRKAKLQPRDDGPFKVVAKVKNSAYAVALNRSDGVSATFNKRDLSPYDGPFSKDRSHKVE
ncbi:unnamed protein product [Cuscuta campestris]|uniref:Integrase zinc-binding domain-containing protein n=1 Tax=Cuscuta campestris TaxID=132261 RepID=A0A484LPM8_9ASTE|nr:unnamed protein product [Cuscuta campestris]